MSYNNFRKAVAGTGVYIAETGHDSNPGTSADAPKKSPAAIVTAASATNIIGAGYYTGGLGAGSSNNHIAEGDGLVIIDLNTGTTPRATQLRNLEIKNGTWNANNFLFACQHIGCRFKNITGTLPSAGGQTAVHTRFDTCILSDGAAALAGTVSSLFKAQYVNCIIVSNGLFQGQMFSNCYIGPDAVIQIGMAAGGAVPTGNSVTPPTVINVLSKCNVNGLIRLPIAGSATQDYAVQDQYLGTPQDNGYAVNVHWLNEANLTADGFIGTVSGWDTLVSDNLINRDPEFLNEAADNYNLMSNSPHIASGFSGTNIGGTQPGDFTAVTEDGIGTVTILKSPEIDDSVPSSLRLAPGETEGYVRIIKFVSRTIQELIIDAQFLFDSDQAGGSATNNNVPDSEPLTANYASKTATSAGAVNQNDIIVPTGLISVGQFVRVAGEVREVTNVAVSSPNDTVTVDTNFRAVVGSAVTVTYGTESQIAVLNPNRLTVQMRVSKNSITNPPDPNLDSDWDNDVDPGYGVVGDYFHQEINEKPGLYIITGNVFGAGDSGRPAGGTLQEIGNCWVDVKVWIRDNFNHNGI